MDASLCQRIEGRLSSDPLGHMMALKFLALRGADSLGGLVEEGQLWASWFGYVPSLNAYDAQTYGERSRVIYWNANDQQLARRVAEAFESRAVVKVSSEPCLSLAEASWRRARSLVWLTTQAEVVAQAGVVETDDPDAAVRELSRLNGYHEAEVAEQRLRGCRWFSASYDGQTVALCFVQPNTGPYWEVSGVLVRPEFRGRGLAQAVVAAAVNHLLRRGLRPRYVVDAENAPSLAVARRLGLREAGSMSHFLVG